MSVELAAKLILKKWLRKGNMARAMRDILPASGLSMRERSEVAAIVHNVVRFKKLYDYILGENAAPDDYIALLKNAEKVERAAERAYREGRLDIFYSTSLPVAKIFQQYPEFAARVNREPETHIAVNLARVSRENVRKVLAREDIHTRMCYPETCLVAEPHARYSSVISDGFAIVQDASSQQISKLVAALGDDILDYCAGSGGKSFTIKFFNPDARVYVHDASERKLQSLFKRAEVLNLKFEKFDGNSEHGVVLVDAPCSGLGSAARNPEAKYREDMDTFPPLQMEILEEAQEHVKPDGYLVYVVCTFNPDETYRVVERFLAEHGEFEEVPVNGPALRAAPRGAFVVAGDVMYVAILHRLR